jgi:hypothetical protein
LDHYSIHEGKGSYKELAMEVHRIQNIHLPIILRMHWTKWRQKRPGSEEPDLVIPNNF